MNLNVKRSAFALSALGVISLVRAGSSDVSPVAPHTAAQSPEATPLAANDVRSQLEGVVAEVLNVVTGGVDTASAASGTATGPLCVAPTVYDPGSKNCIDPTDTSQGDRNSQGSVATAVPTAAPNPFATGPSCVQIVLPFTKTGSTCVDNNPANGGAIVVYAKDAMKLLSAAIGGVIILMIVIAGVQYIISLGNSGQIAAAKKRLTNAITALVLFAMAFAILNFLIPGGLT